MGSGWKRCSGFPRWRAVDRPRSIFPRVEEGPSPHLEPLSAAEALFELMPNVLVTEPSATQAHMNMLGDLVRTVPGYRFRPGRDPDAAAASVASLLS